MLTKLVIISQYIYIWNHCVVHIKQCMISITPQIKNKFIKWWIKNNKLNHSNNEHGISFFLFRFPLISFKNILYFSVTRYLISSARYVHKHSIFFDALVHRFFSISDCCLYIEIQLISYDTLVSWNIFSFISFFQQFFLHI